MTALQGGERASLRDGGGDVSELASGHGRATGTTTPSSWWLVDAEQRVLAGPFGSRLDAALAELSSPGVEVAPLYPAHGVRRDDGTLARVDAPARLVRRYGTEAPVVAGLGGGPVVEGRPETLGELRFAVRAEGARSVADLLDRRTRIGLVGAERAPAAAVAAAVIASEE